MQDTVTGMLLAGVGNVDHRRQSNYLVVDKKTSTAQIEEAFKDFTTREDVAIVLISQYIADDIRYTIERYNKTVPAILEIPSKEHPYDPSKDSVLAKVKHMFNDDGQVNG